MVVIVALTGDKSLEKNDFQTSQKSFSNLLLMFGASHPSK